MSLENITYLIVYMVVLIGLAYPLGSWINLVLEGQFAQDFDRKILSVFGFAPDTKTNSQTYLKHILVFNAFGFVFLFFILLFQGFFPLNPQHFSGLSWHLAFNTAVSFVTNTNWQSYSGESTLSYFSQMVGLTVQNFLSAATGLAIIAAIARSLKNKGEDQCGHFYIDMIRSCLYILLPLSLLYSVMFLIEGVPQSFAQYLDIQTLEGAKQVLPTGPVASQLAIKQLGTNGGGFFGVNSAHPLENPTPFSDFIQLIAILLLPVAQVFAFGKMTLQKKHANALFATMLILFFGLLAFSLYSEFSYTQTDLTMEGKETRFGVLETTLWSVATTAASNGSVNGMHSSLSPLSGLVCLFNMMTGEVIFGGVGSGLYGILLYVIVTVFLAGLMVGRSPEYFGKKIEAYEVRLALYALLIPCACILLSSALACLSQWGLSSQSHQGPHGLSEILYAFTSALGNNGSAFAGYNANTPVINTLLGLGMLIGRFVVIIPVMKLAGSLAMKRYTPPSNGTFPTDSPSFVILLLSTILIIGALTFFPVLVLAPVAEHFLMLAGQTF